MDDASAWFILNQHAERIAIDAKLKTLFKRDDDRVDPPDVVSTVAPNSDEELTLNAQSEYLVTAKRIKRLDGGGTGPLKNKPWALGVCVATELLLSAADEKCFEQEYIEFVELMLRRCATLGACSKVALPLI